MRVGIIIFLHINNSFGLSFELIYDVLFIWRYKNLRRCIVRGDDVVRCTALHRACPFQARVGGFHADGVRDNCSIAIWTNSHDPYVSFFWGAARSQPGFNDVAVQEVIADDGGQWRDLTSANQLRCASAKAATVANSWLDGTRDACSKTS